MQEIDGQPSSMVPSAHQGHSTNFVLERGPEMPIRRTHWSPTPPPPSKKGGLTHQLDNFQRDTSTIEFNICQAYKQYTRLKKDTSRCDTWLKQLVEAQAQEQKTTTKSICKKIHTTEKIRNNAKMIKTALAGLTNRQGLTHVIGPHPTDPNCCVKSKMQAELETLCLMEAGRCFTQAATTPFLQLPLIKLFTEVNLLTKAFDQVLEGTFICPVEVDKMMK